MPFCPFAIHGKIYHQEEYHDHDIDTEICQAVAKLQPDSDKVKFKKLPAIETVVSVMHKGPYQRPGETYTFAVDWIERNGYKICDNPRESYIDGIWNGREEDDWLTELQFPVKKV